MFQYFRLMKVSQVNHIVYGFVCKIPFFSDSLRTFMIYFPFIVDFNFFFITQFHRNTPQKVCSTFGEHFIKLHVFSVFIQQHPTASAVICDHSSGRSDVRSRNEV